MQDSFLSDDFKMPFYLQICSKSRFFHHWTSLGTSLHVAVYRKCMACNTLSDCPTMSYGEMCFCQFEYIEQNTRRAKLTFLVRFPLLAISNRNEKHNVSKDQELEQSEPTKVRHRNQFGQRYQINFQINHDTIKRT